MSDNYEVWYRDPQEVVHNILMSSEFADEMDYVLYREYNTLNDQRCWQDFMSGDWAWEQVVCSPSHLVINFTNVKLLG